MRLRLHREGLSEAESSPVKIPQKVRPGADFVKVKTVRWSKRWKQGRELVAEYVYARYAD